MNYKFTIGRRARREEQIPNNYEIIDLDKYDSDKPIVLVLGGNGSTDDRTANGNAKVVSSLLGVFNNDIDLLAINYNQGLGEPNISNNCKELVDKLFLPCVNQNGKRIDIVSACKNMRKFTIFAHCRGGDGVMKRLIPILDQELANLQYTNIEREQIIAQIVMVAYGTNHKDIIRGVKGVYCLSFADDMYRKGAIHLSDQFLSKLDIINMVATDKELLKKIYTDRSLIAKWRELTYFLKWHRRVYSLREHNNIRLFAHGLYQTDNHLWLNDHSISELARNDDWTRHKNASSTGDFVSRCLACALCNSVANSIMNKKYKQFIRFDMEQLQAQMDTICRQHNYEQTKLDNVDLETELEL